MTHLNVTAMPRVNSNHYAIILSSNQLDFGPYPFRFFNYWLKDPDLFQSVVACKLRNLREHIKSLRKEIIEKTQKRNGGAYK